MIRYSIHTTLKTAVKSAGIDMTGLGKAIDKVVARAGDVETELTGAKVNADGELMLKGKAEALVTLENDGETIVGQFIALAMDYARFARKWDMATVTLPSKMAEQLASLFPKQGN